MSNSKMPKANYKIWLKKDQRYYTANRKSVWATFRGALDAARSRYLQLSRQDRGSGSWLNDNVEIHIFAKAQVVSWEEATAVERAELEKTQEKREKRLQKERESRQKAEQERALRVFQEAKKKMDLAVLQLRSLGVEVSTENTEQ
jgi:hypothetical protein